MDTVEVKKRVFEIRSKLAGDDRYMIVDSLRGLTDTLEEHFGDDWQDLNPETVTITLKEMTQAEIDALPIMESFFE